jgi:hypothetical protein
VDGGPAESPKHKKGDTHPKRHAKMNFNQSENKKRVCPWLKRTVASGETFVFFKFLFLNYIAVYM